jgi:hypothetical protein
MHVVRNWLSGKAVFDCTDHQRAHRVTPDLNGGILHWWWKPRQLGDQHQYDADFHEDRHRELAECKAGYNA